MKKYSYLVAMAVLALTAFSCQTDEILDLPVTPPTPEPEVPAPKSVLLGINPTIGGMEAVTRGVITEFTIKSANTIKKTAEIIIFSGFAALVRLCSFEPVITVSPSYKSLNLIHS